eukprot:Clim_evm17s240 gene=Clim_evmTU17s240
MPQRRPTRSSHPQPQQYQRPVERSSSLAAGVIGAALGAGAVLLAGYFAGPGADAESDHRQAEGPMEERIDPEYEQRYVTTSCQQDYNDRCRGKSAVNSGSRRASSPAGDSFHSADGDEMVDEEDDLALDDSQVLASTSNQTSLVSGSIDGGAHVESGRSVSLLTDPRSRQVLEDNLVCPITQCIPSRPLISKYGHIYDGEAIHEWVSHSGRCPVTNLELTEDDLYPCYGLANLINAWHQEQMKGDIAAKQEGGTDSSVGYTVTADGGLQSLSSFERAPRFRFERYTSRVEMCTPAEIEDHLHRLNLRLQQQPRVRNVGGSDAQLEDITATFTPAPLPSSSIFILLPGIPSSKQPGEVILENRGRCTVNVYGRHLADPQRPITGVGTVRPQGRLRMAFRQCHTGPGSTGRPLFGEWAVEVQASSLEHVTHVAILKVSGRASGGAVNDLGMVTAASDVDVL